MGGPWLQVDLPASCRPANLAKGGWTVNLIFVEQKEAGGSERGGSNFRVFRCAPSCRYLLSFPARQDTRTPGARIGAHPGGALIRHRCSASNFPLSLTLT